MTRGARAGDLKVSFSELGVPTSSKGRVYEAVRIARNSRYRVGRDSESNPVILIKTSDLEGAPTLPDFEGRHLRVNHYVNCSITVADVRVEHSHFSVVTCVDADELLRDRFFDAMETVLRSLGESPTAEDFSHVVVGLIELFRLATQPARGTVQGLWAELWLIANAGEPLVVLDAWHSEPTDVYDFNSGSQRIEVKSSGQRKRIHHFSHRQLAPPVDAQAVICSIFVEGAGSGPTVSTLVREIRRKVHEPHALRHLDFIVADTLGVEWRAGTEIPFDAELASESLRFHRVDDVPSLPSPVPHGVSDIRYMSDLSEAQALTREELLGDGELFAAAVPEYT